jgi:hypothetical protein
MDQLQTLQEAVGADVLVLHVSSTDGIEVLCPKAEEAHNAALSGKKVVVVVEPLVTGDAFPWDAPANWLRRVIYTALSDHRGIFISTTFEKAIKEAPGSRYLKG